MATGEIVKTYRSREEIACEINVIKANVLRTALQGAIDVGRLLCEAKEVVAHGEWGMWLEENVSYSTTTANDLMRLYREYNDDQIKLFGRSNEELYGKLSISQALALLALPAPAREEFVETHDMEEISVRELKEEVAGLKEALQKAEVMAQAAEVMQDNSLRLMSEAEEREKAAKANAEQMAAKLEKAEKKANDALVKAQREAAKAKADADAARQKLEEAKRENEQLQIKLDEKPEPEVVEKIVEQLPADYEMLKEDNARMEKQLMLSDKVVSEIGLLIEDLQRVYAGICDRLEEVKSPDVREKLEAALARVVQSWGGGAVISRWRRVNESKIICEHCGKMQYCELDEHTTEYCPCCGSQMLGGGMTV